MFLRFPLDMSFAPIVVIPPCPTNVWKNRAIADMTVTGNGPSIIAANGVPTGCEHEPVTGTGYVPNGYYEDCCAH